jgi:hypothetical protein
VSRILESIKDFSIDVTDNLGKSALRLAIENEHLEVLKKIQILIYYVNFIFLPLGCSNFN